MRMHYLVPTHLVQWRTGHWQAFQKAPCWNEDWRHNKMAQFHPVWQRIHWSALREWAFWSNREWTARELNVISHNWVLSQWLKVLRYFKRCSLYFSQKSLASLGKCILKLIWHCTNPMIYVKSISEKQCYQVANLMTLWAHTFSVVCYHWNYFYLNFGLAAVTVLWLKVPLTCEPCLHIGLVSPAAPLGFIMIADECLCFLWCVTQLRPRLCATEVKIQPQDQVEVT